MAQRERNVESKRELHAQAIKRCESEIEADLYKWDYFFIDEKLKKLQADFEKLEAKNTTIFADAGANETIKKDCIEQTKTIERLYFGLKSKLRIRAEALSKQAEKDEAQVESELQKNDELSNENKFEALIKACIGTEAEKIVLELSENKFEKAFEKLKWLFGSS